MMTPLLEAVRWALFSLSHALGGSLGTGIIALSVVVRLALLPWGLRAARRGVATRVAMDAIKPRLRAIEARYKGDSAKLRDALVAEYRNAGLNPISAMNPGLLAVQIPVGWAVYTVISNGLSAGDAFLWIANLASPDATISIIVGGLTTVMGATLPTTGGPVSPLVLATIMGIGSCLVVFHMSAGIGLYWASNTCVGILQNTLLRLPPPPVNRQ